MPLSRGIVDHEVAEEVALASARLRPSGFPLLSVFFLTEASNALASIEAIGKGSRPGMFAFPVDLCLLSLLTN